MTPADSGKRHVDWLMRAKIPNFSGDVYRSNFEASVRAIEAEAVVAERARLVAAVRGLRDEAQPDGWYRRGRSEMADAYAAVLVLLEPEP